MKNQRGFVLLTVLLFIQIYALIGMSALLAVLLEQKLIADQKSRRLLLNEAELRLSRLAASIASLSEFCRITPQPESRFRSRPLSWWAASSCTESAAGYRSYYVVENLASDPCAQFYRLTLLLTHAPEADQKVLLQATIALPAPESEHCDAQPHSVNWGPQSWHELI